MPSDHDITDEEAQDYFNILKYLEKNPKESFIPYLIGSVSQNTGLGMYEYIGDVLTKFPKDIVIPHIKNGIKEGNEGCIYRCCWWATDIDAWELGEEIEPLTTHSNEDINEAASSFIKLKSELA